MIWAVLAVAIGATVQSAVGFGMAMIAAPLLLLIDIRLVPGPLLASGLVLTALMVGRERAGIDPPTVGWAVLGGVPGTFLGAAVIALVPSHLAGIVLGGVVLGGVGMSATGYRVAPTTPAIVSAGAASGVMGTVASMGGPPLALLYQDADAAMLRGTMAGYFTISIIVALSALAVVGRFGPAEWSLAVPLLPGVLVGFLVGGRIAHRLDQRATRRAILWVCGIAAVAVIVRYGVVS